MALGIGLAGTSATLAAPANGEATAEAAYLNPLIEPVYWRHYYYHWHWHWHR